MPRKNKGETLKATGEQVVYLVVDAIHHMHEVQGNDIAK